MATKKKSKKNEPKPMPYEAYDPRQTEFPFVKDCRPELPPYGITPHDPYTPIDPYVPVPSPAPVPSMPVLTGWKCPVCGRVLSPGTSVCPCYMERAHPVQNPTISPYPTSPDYWMTCGGAVHQENEQQHT